MSETAKVFLLSIIQGISEFLPISSSGHLILIEHYLNTSLDANEILLLNLILHLGTMLATVIFFRQKLIDMLQSLFSKEIVIRILKNPSSIQQDKNLWLTYLIFISIIPTGIIALALKQTQLLSPSWTWLSVFFLVTGLINWTIHQNQNDAKDNSFLQTKIHIAIFIGIAQGLAILPGISRSGITIATALLLGLSRQQSLQFSFLASIPVILLANGWQLMQGSIESYPVHLLMLGFSIAFVVGYISLYLLKHLLHQQRFAIFTYYCICLALALQWIS